MKKLSNYHLAKVYAKNIGGLREIEIFADRSVIEIAGKNGAGKTTVMQLLEIALRKSAKKFPELLRAGSRKGKVEVTLKEVNGEERIVIERKFKKNSSIMKAHNAAGEKIKQVDLMAFIDEFTFAPEDFCKLKNNEIISLFQPIIEEKNPDFFNQVNVLNERINESRMAIKENKSIVKKTNWLPEVKRVEKVCINEIRDKISSAEKYNLEQIKATEAKSNARAEVGRARSELSNVEQRIFELQTKKNALIGKIEVLEREYESLPDGLERMDIKHLMEELTDSSAQNEKYISYCKYVDNVKYRLELEREIVELEDLRDDSIEKREELLLSVEFPIKNMSWDGENIRIDGIVWEQIEKSRRMEISLEVLMAKNPSLKVMYLHGSEALDDDRFKSIVKAMVKHGYQIWVEKVGEPRTSDAVILSEGEIV